MTPSARGHIAHLDGWRGLAILMVLIGHFGGQGLGWLGPFGVMLFFVLSGRLMCQLLFIKQVPLTTFFVRRFSRILPTFWLYVLAMFAFAGTLQPTLYQVGLQELASTMLFLRTYLPGETTIATRQWAIGHIWSLNVEEHSYLFLAAGALLCRGAGRRSLAAVFLFASMLAAIFINLYYTASPPAGPSPWYMRSECASLGILSGAAFWYAKETYAGAFLARLPWFVPVLTFLVGVVCFGMYAHKGVDKLVAPLCLALCVVCIDRIPAVLKTLLALAPMRWLGTCSFSLYLWQQPFFVATLTQDVNRPLAAALAVGFGALSFYAFEDPVRQKINDMWDRRHKAIVPAEGLPT